MESYLSICVYFIIPIILIFIGILTYHRKQYILSSIMFIFSCSYILVFILVFIFISTTQFISQLMTHKIY